MPNLGKSAKRVIVMGISSFIGYHVACWLAERGFHVIGTMSKALSRYQGIRRKRLGFAAAAGVRLRTLDITEENQIVHLIESEKPDVWIHHAGLAGNDVSYDYDLHKGHRLNVAPLPLIYKALKKNGCSGVILTGSGEEYSMLPALSFEEDPCWPLMPYGLSKLAVTVRSFQLSQQFELQTRVARIFIPFGPLDDPEKMLPRVVLALKDGRPIPLPPCMERRDFLHVDDVCAGYELLLEDLSIRDAWFDIFNLSSGEGTIIRKMLTDIARLLKADPKLLEFNRISANEEQTMFLAGANDKAKGLLQWHPCDLRERLSQYVQEEGS
jgi:nucleoside-diphosphate-sugar epimerase